MFKNKTKILTLIAILFVISIFFFFGEKAYAACCNGQCCNGPSKTNPGDCAPGCPACGADTNTEPWKKYNCGMYFDGACWQQWTSEYICSLGDKCISGEKGLRPGYCACGTYGFSIYKSCCQSSTPVNCTAYYQQDPYTPDEGVCPAGSQTISGPSCPASCGSCQYLSGGVCYNYCSGADTQCGCATCANCNNSDGWVNVGSTYSCCDGSNLCTCQNQEYRNYYCSGAGCTYSVTNNQIVKSGCAYNSICVACSNDCSSGQKRCSGSYVQNCTECDADLCLDWCDYEYCSYGCSGGVCNSAPAGCNWNSGCPSTYPYYWPNDPCGGSWCWSQCPRGGCCCNPNAWCCWDAGFAPAANCACGEGGADWGCCPSTTPIDCAGRCYSAGTLCTGCNGNLITSPAVTTNDAALMGKNSAQLSGNVTSVNNANPDQRILEWGIVSGNYLWSHDSGGGGTGVFSYTPNDLTPGTTYYFRAKAHNAAGWGYGNQKSFTTLNIPSVTTNDADNIGATTARINGTLTKDGGLACRIRFLYAKQVDSYPDSSWTGYSYYSGNNSSLDLSGLAKGTTYRFRFEAENSLGKASGVDKTFTTLKTLPSVTTNDADNIGATAARIHGVLNDDGGEACSVRFLYAKQGDSYPDSSWTGYSYYSGNNSSLDLSGLAKGATYKFKFEARNSLGQISGSEKTFTTLATIPIVSTNDASLIEETTTTLNGNVTDVGGENPTRYFDWDIDSGEPYANTENCGVGGAEPYSKGLTGLTPGTTYYFIAKAHNSAGWGYGSEKSFTTKPNPPSSLADSARTKDSIVLQWVKGSGAEKTMIRDRIDAYPSSPSEGTQAYFGTESSCTVSGLSSGQIYYFRAWSYKSGAPNSGYSDDYSQDTAYTKPGDPSGLTATAISQTQINLTWAKGAGGDKTMIRRKIGDYPASVNDGNEAYFDTGIAKNDTGLSCGIHYYYRAWAYDSDSGYYSDGYSSSDATTYSCSNPPTASNLKVNAYNDIYCGNNPAQYFSWVFSDFEDGSNQTAYRLQVSTSSTFSPLQFDSGNVTSSVQERYVEVRTNPGSNQLGYNTSYYWRIKVWDIGGNDSGQIQYNDPLDADGNGNPQTFTTPAHLYPYPKFTFDNRVYSVGEVVAFVDESTCYYPGGSYSCKSTHDSVTPTYAWDFDYNGTFAPSSIQRGNVTTIYNQADRYNVRLVVTDDLGVCYYDLFEKTNKKVSVGLSLPEWKEIAPF